MEWAERNPTLASALAGTAANVYGANLEGNAINRQLDLEEEERRQRMRPRTPFREWQQDTRARYGYGQ